MTPAAILTPYQSQYVAWLLSRRMAGDSADLLASTFVDAQVLMDLARAELQGRAQFDETGFTLRQTPLGVPEEEATPWRYELPRRSGEAHL